MFDAEMTLFVKLIAHMRWVSASIIPCKSRRSDEWPLCGGAFVAYGLTSEVGSWLGDT